MRVYELTKQQTYCDPYDMEIDLNQFDNALKQMFNSQ